jgi:hypothetical protein
LTIPSMGNGDQRNPLPNTGGCMLEQSFGIQFSIL